MPQDSKAKKFNRRIRRDRTLAYKMLDIAISQRDEARTMVMLLQNELRKYLPPAEPEGIPQPPVEDVPVINEPQEGPQVG